MIRRIPSPTLRIRAVGACVGLTVLSISAVAGAHPLAPSSLHLVVARDGTVDVRWRTPSVGPVGQTLEPVLPTHCRTVERASSTMTRDRAAVERRYRVDCGAAGLVGHEVSVRGLSATTTNVIVDVTLPDGGRARALLHEGENRFLVPATQGSGAVAAGYLRLGVEHLITGVDHVLFVLGLLLLIRGRRLLGAITAFTLGHSLSLALSVLGLVRVPTAPVEIGIALTIVILALDILRSHVGKSPGPVARWPWALCSLFGLLHGLGFAGALTEAGLPAHAVPLSLLCFNLGIEVGQLAIVGLALLLAALVGGRLPRSRLLTRLGPAYAIGSLAAFWVLERGFAAMGLPLP